MYAEQSIHFVGLLRKDPELVYGPTGNPVFRTTLTLFSSFTSQGGETKTARAYAPIRAYGLMAETAMARLRRGCWITCACKYRTTIKTLPGGGARIYHHFDMLGFDLMRLPGQDIHDFPETTAELVTEEYAAEGASGELG